MRRISRNIALAGIFLVPFFGAGCERAEQEAEQTTTTSTPTTGTTTSSEQAKKAETVPPEAKFTQLLADCSAAGKGETLQKIADAVALVNKLPKPLTVPCFIAALPRPFQLAATDSIFSGQPAKDRIQPRFILQMNDLLITLVSAGAGKDKVELSELRGSTESVKGELAFPITGEVGPEQPYVGIFNKANGTTSCGFCHVGERLVGTGYPAEATISRALAPGPNTVLLRFEIVDVAEQCKTNLSPGCQYWRALFHEGAPAEYVIPSDMPLK